MRESLPQAFHSFNAFQRRAYRRVAKEYSTLFIISFQASLPAAFSVKHSMMYRIDDFDFIAGKFYMRECFRGRLLPARGK